MTSRAILNRLLEIGERLDRIEERQEEVLQAIRASNPDIWTNSELENLDCPVCGVKGFHVCSDIISNGHCERSKVY